jgi:hypothetical protein
VPTPEVPALTSGARPASGPEHEVEVRFDVRIPARDGVELSANLWLPVARPDRPGERFPALLEMIPYGKDSWRRNADLARGDWFARRGYAVCRVDVRGTGSSGGIALDEYTAAETLDGYDAVEWLAAQPWCSSRVGMWGISYGGFTAIQVAALRPPHLAAIVPFYATDDRYLDDVHYRGGCVTVSELSQYAVSQVAMNAMPPDPAFRGPGWRDEWRARLEATPTWLFTWLRNQVDGPYWRQGSLAPRYDAIEAAILGIGGWNDSYVDPVLRMHERCTAPRRSIVGNWVHSWPHDAFPGPGIDELHEMTRFLDHWLKGVPNGTMEEAPFTWFEREWAPPEPFPAVWPGRWRATGAVPHPAVESRSWRLEPGAEPGHGRLTGAAVDGPEAEARLPHRPTVGTRSALSWGAGGAPNGLGGDTRPDEARSLVWTSAPLDEPVSILGVPAAMLAVSADVPVISLVCRLMDVAPDGVPHQVAAGILNLTHRDDHAAPSPLEPGVRYDVTVPLRSSGYRFRAGNRLRLVVSTAYWPVIWPSPYRGELAVHLGGPDGSRLVLPVVPAADGDRDVAVPAFRTDPPDVPTVGGGDDEPPRWTVTEDMLAGTVTVETYEGGTSVLPDGRSLFASEHLVMTASDDDPLATTFEGVVVYRWIEHAAIVDIRATAELRSTAEAFDLAVDLEVDLDGERFHERRERAPIPRHLV